MPPNMLFRKFLILKKLSVAYILLIHLSLKRSKQVKWICQACRDLSLIGHCDKTLLIDVKPDTEQHTRATFITLITSEARFSVAFDDKVVYPPKRLYIIYFRIN